MMSLMDERRPVRPLAARVATLADVPTIAALLHAFNVEFTEPSPGPIALAGRLSRLLAGDNTVALLAGEPTVGLALLTLRSNVWYDGPVALIDELYVVPAMRAQGIGTDLLAFSFELLRSRGVELMEVNVDGEDRDARRFYERHGFSCVDGDDAEPALYYSRELS